ncbi:MAG: YggS family pyridoxal phosphate-dependent enzyme [Verrucomicrobiae bacterium]|nr:YggS family pyridoxal phosphate-dependent enzyme [Verrucomicrobiae bacterium]
MALEENLEIVRQRIRTACERCGRNPESVTLVAVVKGHPPEVVKQAFECGVRIFAENKVQEAKAKIPLCPSGITWHLIGHLQTNKAKDAVQLFDMIHSVDSLKLAEEINKRSQQIRKKIPVLLEINVSGELSKFGYAPSILAGEIKKIAELPSLDIQGLMTMAPFVDNPELTRPFFRKLRELKNEYEQILNKPLPHLSMGMTNDFEIAIEEGATMVRIGTAIFGERSGWKYSTPQND